MKILKSLVLICSLLMLSAVSVKAFPILDIPDKIFQAMKVGNIDELSKYFNSSIELVVLDKEDVYSKQQAIQILKNFFVKYKVKNFTLLHQGGKEESQYAIGTLETDQGKFRVYFLVKQKGAISLIHQLRIEEE